MATFESLSKNTIKNDIILCHVEPKQRLVSFDLVSGAIYKKTVSHFVSTVSQNGVNLAEYENETLIPGTYFYNPNTNELFVRMSDDSEPKTNRVILSYRMFYSTASIDLPNDLENGSEVNYDGRLKSNSPIKKELDEEQVGIVVEANTTLTLENTDYYFDRIFDVLVWENAVVKLWVWNEKLPMSEKRKIFEGTVKNKTFSASRVGLRCKDSTYTLRVNVQSENFSSDDGSVADNYLNKPKRKIFGRVKQLQCTPVDNILDGYPLTGTITAFNTGDPEAIGIGTNFLLEASQGDEIILNKNGVEYRATIENVTDNETLVLDDNFPVSFQNESLTLKPRIDYRKKNRNWHIAGHKLTEPSTTITEILQNNRFNVADPSQFVATDRINVNGLESRILRVSGSTIVLRSNLQGSKPEIGDVVTKNSVSQVFIDGVEAFTPRDYTVSNTDTNAILNISEDFEKNVAPIIPFESSLIFTSGSNVIGVFSGDPTGEISARDWIQSPDEGNPDFYEVLSVTETEVRIRENYPSSSITGVGKYKNPNIIKDGSIVTVNCLGMEKNGTWIKTAPEAIKELISSDAGLTNINEQSFIDASLDAPALCSIALPRRIGQDNSTIKKAIELLNISVLGSLIMDSNYDFKYFALTSDIPTGLEAIKDDDLRGDPVIDSKNEIVKSIHAKYRYFVDKFTASESFELYEFDNQFVSDMIGVISSREIDIHLFNSVDVEEIAERYSLYNSLSQSTVKIKGGQDLALKELNSKIYLKLDRLYDRFGNGDNQKIGIINKITNNLENVTLEINDLGNSFNRVAVICEDDASDYSIATNEEKIINSYIVDDDALTPDVSDDSQIYNNLIG